jgi:hypothetical protein
MVWDSVGALWVEERRGAVAPLAAVPGRDAPLLRQAAFERARQLVRRLASRARRQDRGRVRRPPRSRVHPPPGQASTDRPKMKPRESSLPASSREPPSLAFSGLHLQHTPVVFGCHLAASDREWMTATEPRAGGAFLCRVEPAPRHHRISRLSELLGDTRSALERRRQPKRDRVRSSVGRPREYPVPAFVPASGRSGPSRRLAKRLAVERADALMAST